MPLTKMFRQKMNQKMTISVEKPCVYHYRFSRMPAHGTDHEIQALAQTLSNPIAEAHHLNQNERFTHPLPMVQPISYSGNDKTKTYLLQFLFNDILTTILVLNQTNGFQDPLAYLAKTSRMQFCVDEPMPLGESTVLYVRAPEELEVVRSIASKCFDAELNQEMPSCKFEWGTHYFVPDTNGYVLLVSEAANLVLGDTFLAFDFPMLEVIRQKLIYEEQESQTLKQQNFRIESKLKILFKDIITNLDGETDTLEEIDDLLDKMDDNQAELYDNVYRTEAALHTLRIGIRNLEQYLEQLPIVSDDLFRSLPGKFKFTHEIIDTNLKYSKLFMPIINRQQETIQLKISLLRQRAQEQNNRIEKRQNTLLAVIGVFIGVGEVLSAMDWRLKVLWMGVAGLVAFVLVRLFDLRILHRKRRR